jgi:hypothetical protein
MLDVGNLDIWIQFTSLEFNSVIVSTHAVEVNPAGSFWTIVVSSRIDFSSTCLIDGITMATINSYPTQSTPVTPLLVSTVPNPSSPPTLASVPGTSSPPTLASRPPECPICLDDLQKIKRIVLTLPCGHTYCRKCIIGYVREEIQNRLEIPCPHPTCQQILDLKGLINRVRIKQAQKRTRRPNACPSVRCLGTLVNFECDVCHLRVCRECGELQHLGRSCQPQIRASYRKIQQEARPCPHCQVLIYKDGGCNNVHCRRCNTSFDWETLRTHTEIRQGIQQPRLQSHDAWRRSHSAFISQPAPPPPASQSDELTDEEIEQIFQAEIEQIIERSQSEFQLGDNSESAMHSGVHETHEPLECRTCQRLCFNQTGLCCSCVESTGEITINVQVEPTIPDRTRHYCPLCQ